MKLSIVVLTCDKDFQYLGDCIQSLRDCIQFPDYEVIIVNNSSQSVNIDGCIVINNETNLYPFESRRIGLDNSKGEYVWFVDCDDVAINSLYLEEIPDADIIQFNFDNEIEPNRFLKRFVSWEKSRIIGEFFYGLWSRFFKREFLVKLLEPVKRPLYLIHKDDNFIMDYSLTKTDNIKFIKKTLYCYKYYRAKLWDSSKLDEKSVIDYLYSIITR